MKKCGEYIGRILEWWVERVYRHALIVAICALVVTVLALVYSVRNFTINVDIGEMISKDLPFRKLERDFAAAFPILTDTIVVVLDAETPERAEWARGRLAARLRKEPALFRSVYEPGGNEFFQRNGLLYLSVDALQEFADTLAGAQPLLGLISQDMSIRGLFSLIEILLGQKEAASLQGNKIEQILDQVSAAFEGVLQHRPHQLSWQGLMLGKKEFALPKQQFIIIQPYLDRTAFNVGEKPIRELRRIVRELGLAREMVRVRITGDIALDYENLLTVRNSVGIATIASLLLVGILLYVGFGRSGPLVIASVATLLAGLILTTAFAVIFIGSLNLISITFAVLFIGLGIDYSIQFCMRLKELVAEGQEILQGLRTTACGIGRGLLVSCITVAIGFYSFVPTAYAGVGELGIIAGTGMFIAYFATITFLPAILILMRISRRKISKRRLTPERFRNAIVEFPYVHRKIVLTGGVLLGGIAVLFLPGVYFDYNPLNLYNPSSESVVAIQELFRDTEIPPWTISVLTKSKKDAEVLAERLQKLKEVQSTVTIFDFIPKDQPQKLAIISDIALFLPPFPKTIEVKSLTFEEYKNALQGLKTALKTYLHTAAPGEDRAAALRLSADIGKFEALLKDPEQGREAFHTLQSELLSNLPPLLKRLEYMTQAEKVSLADLPEEIVQQYMSVDGRYRVQVVPSENILDREALKRFVTAVQRVAPNATDAPVVLYESGVAVVQSFKQAMLYAVVAIIVFLLLDLRSIRMTAQIVTPFILSILLTVAMSVVLGIPFNFANIIIVPLLLGIGVHSGVMVAIRFHREPPPDGNMLRTSTARAVLLSILATLVSTSSLSLSAHRGISSIGKLLSICLIFLLLSTLIFLPALLQKGKSDREIS